MLSSFPASSGKRDFVWALFAVERDLLRAYGERAHPTFASLSKTSVERIELEEQGQGRRIAAGFVERGEVELRRRKARPQSEAPDPTQAVDSDTHRYFAGAKSVPSAVSRPLGRRAGTGDPSTR